MFSVFPLLLRVSVNLGRWALSGRNHFIVTKFGNALNRFFHDPLSRATQMAVKSKEVWDM